MKVTQASIKLHYMEWALTESRDFFNVYKAIKKSNKGYEFTSPNFIQNAHIMNMALSIELASKALHYGAKKNISYPTKPIRKHDLDELFNSLPNAIKKRIFCAFEKHYPYQNMFGRDFENMLRLHRDMFTRWRYNYEMKNGQFHPYFCEAYLQAQIEVIEEEIKKLKLIFYGRVA